MRITWRSFVGVVCLGCVFSAEAGPDLEQFQFRLPQRRSFRVESDVAKGRGARTLPAFDEGDRPVEFYDRVVLAVNPPEAAAGLIAGTGLALSREVAPGVFILQAPDAVGAARAAGRLCGQPGVVASYPVLSQPASLDGPYAWRPNDPFFYVQWPLENRRTNNAVRIGLDMNARAAWPWTKGEGVTIAIADLGVELSHPELSAATLNGLHFNFGTGRAEGLPLGDTPGWAHGTEVAGLIGARSDNRLGMAGVAPAAQLASWVIFRTNQTLVSDEALMDMYQYASGAVSVQNHSWTHKTLGQEAPTLLEQIGISNAVTHGRNGKGVVMVRSAGNDRERGGSADDDGYPGDPRVVSVAAVRPDGRVAGYSEPGACVLVGGPSADVDVPGLFTTDLVGVRGVNRINFLPPNTNLNDYVFDAFGFSGTSAAAALISGAAGLIVSANPNLTRRDVQQVFIFSARHWDLADPDLRTNGAGFRVSHNQGFGVPDLGWAVAVARAWSNRPPATQLVVTGATPAAIPDGGLLLLIAGQDVPPNLASIAALAGTTGPFPDEPTPSLPLVDVGTALAPIAVNVAGKAALIQRVQTEWPAQITNVAAAGAAFAVIYNNATGNSDCGGGNTLCPLLRTDFVPIPAVFIGQADGEALRDRLPQAPDTFAQARLFSTNLVFTVTSTLVCEQVTVRLQTDHPLRGDLRITLISPQGTRSVLQRLNQDTNAGPVDWSYTSTHHYFESSAGRWELAVGDQFQGFSGTVQFASLTITGVAITDTDSDGLDDGWELSRLGSLAWGPRDDPDGDGASNAREQVLGTNPLAQDMPAAIEVSRWNGQIARLSWPGIEGQSYTLFGATNVAGGFAAVTNVLGRYPETESFVFTTNQVQQYFQVNSP